MIEISNSTAQTLTPGQAIAFDVTNLKTRCTAECHKTGMTDVRLRLNGIYEIVFSGQHWWRGQQVPCSLAFPQGMPVLPGSTMISTTAAAGDLNNVAKTMLVGNGCGMYDTIRIVNTGTANLTVGPGANLVVRRIA